MPLELDPKDREILDLIQVEFSLAERPYRALGERAGLSESEAMARIRRLREKGIIRQTSAIFDTRRLGYKSTLVAARLPEARLESGAAAVSRHPGVSHNYERPNRYNLWFTLAVPPDGDLEGTLARMAGEAGFEAYRILPTTRVFRIGLRLDVAGKGRGSTEQPVQGGSRHDQPAAPLTEFDRAAIRELQDDFPIVERPYAPMAERLGISEDALFGWAKRMSEEGRLRRVSGVLRHREAGFTANGMTVWAAPEEQVEAMGTFCAEIHEISHCYQRPAYEDWPYNLYTMIHGRDRASCEAVVKRVLDAFGEVEHEVLYSTREFKKERVRYFVEG